MVTVSESGNLLEILTTRATAARTFERARRRVAAVRKWLVPRDARVAGIVGLR